MKKWKTIKKFKNVIDGYYQISYNGDVRVKKSKKILHKKIANKKHHPYYAVHLKLINGKSEWVLVHQLVATFFCKIDKKYKKTDDLVPDHLDNNGLNNHYLNLEWKTRGENIKEAFKKGFLNNSADNNKNAIVTNDEVHEICKHLENDLTYDEILEKLNFPNTKQYRTLLVRIKNRIAWKSISNNYSFDSDKIKYTKAQLEIVDKLDDIKKLINEGKTNREIIRQVYGNNLSTREMDIKSQSITKIRNNKIYKEII